MSTDTITPDAPPTPDAPTPDAAADGEATKKARAKAPDTSGITADGINSASLASLPDLVAAAAPVRERSDEQKLMDAVAAKAYKVWLDAKRPSVWQKMPVITYFLDDGEVAAYRYLIRRACANVEPEKGASGVRVRFGKEFTLSEAMAAKISHPELAGKTVLAWAAVDKRELAEEKKTNAPTPDSAKNPEVTAVTAKHDAEKRPERPGRK
jgi:hypothetical protein